MSAKYSNERVASRLCYRFPAMFWFENVITLSTISHMLTTFWILMLIQAVYVRGVRAEKSTRHAFASDLFLRNKTGLKTIFTALWIAERWLGMRARVQQKNKPTPTTTHLSWQGHCQSGEHPLVRVAQLLPDPIRGAREEQGCGTPAGWLRDVETKVGHGMGSGVALNQMCFPSNSYVEILTPNVLVFGDGAC